MDLDTLTAWCHSLAKAYSTGVRLYRGAELLVYRSVYPLHPDPAGPYLPRILECGAEVGIITTPVYQFYGFLTVKPGLRVILGPTRFLRGDGRELDELMALLAVPVEEWAGYAQVLRSAPVISAHRLAWLLCSLTTALRGRPFPVEQVWLDTRMEDVRSSVHADHTRQRLEVMTNPSAIERLAQDMMIDYAQRVKRLRGPGKGQDQFYRLCAQYVSQNIFTTIRAERMAEELGYTRAYLCTRFKQEAGISLTRYIQREKVAEARRLLRFTDQELSEIAALLGFSSQSHFQTVFKQIVGETPMAYRRNNQV